MHDTIKKGKGHILVVDDDDVLLFLYREFLEGLNYRITTCTNGRDALTLFKESPLRYDLLITDQTMPDMTGKDLIKKLFALGCSLPFILSSGYMDSLPDDTVQMGGSHFLQKPVHLDVLRQTIEGCLET